MIFDHATVVTVDAERRIVRNGAIAVSGTRIAGVGPRAEILRRFPDDPERTDLRGMVVLPGLVNTHVHQSQALIRGCADDRALVEWLIERVWPLQGATRQRTPGPAPSCACSSCCGPARPRSSRRCW